MEILKNNLLLLTVALFCMFITYLAVNEYYSYLIINAGYLFGASSYSIIPSIILVCSIILFGRLIYDIHAIRGYKLILISSLPVFLSFAYFMYSPLSQEDHIYKIALTNYGKIFNSSAAVYQDKIHNHSEYLRYQYQLDNFDKDKGSRQEYVKFANQQVEKYNNYLKNNDIKIPILYSYYITGKSFNDFVFRYKGVENTQIQEKLHSITKSGVVTYSDMMDFQLKFINDYKNSSKGD